MFAYEWDSETGGVILTTAHVDMSREARPVYASELKLLGLDWKFDEQDDVPYMWAEANRYWYRGRLVAISHGACLYEKPVMEIVEIPEPSGQKLCPIDIEAMIQKNADLLESLVQTTIKSVYHTYLKYKSKIDVFYVAYSGGKDSVVALDIVQRALPHDVFKVLFGDTGMEFSDTYDLAERTERWCRLQKIEFIRARSHLSPIDSWKIFGPPAQTMRWCCSVHKTTPQILKLRELTHNPRFRGMAFTGIRAAESSSRSMYDEVSYGEKINGQYSCHPLLEWSSVEIFIYIYQNKLLFNDAYKKGNGRVGCLVCPLAAAKNMYFKEQSYSALDRNSLGTNVFNKIILDTCSKELSSEDAVKEFMNIAGWKARRSGRELTIAHDVFRIEEAENGFVIKAKNLKSDWMEWMKTIGDMNCINEERYNVLFEKVVFNINVNKTGISTIIRVNSDNHSKVSIQFGAALKTVFRKATYCVYCRVCESQCPYGFIHMKNGEFRIDDKCIKCRNCHDVAGGCLVANSLRLPKGDGMAKESKSIDQYSNHGMELKSLIYLIELKDDFWNSDKMPQNNKAGACRCFLKSAGIVTKNLKLTLLAEIIEKLSPDSELAAALMVCHLAYSPQFNWWIKNIRPNVAYTPDMLKVLLPDTLSQNSKNHVCSAFKVIFRSFKAMAVNVGLGECECIEKETTTGAKVSLKSVTRSAWANPDPRVILYSLYLFAENCNQYYQFTLKRLLNYEIDSDGMSPSQIFCLNRDTMVRILNSLSSDYPDYIYASFTHDLDNITLRPEKTSQDVLNLFR